jgi:hypothetical protein
MGPVILLPLLVMTNSAIPSMAHLPITETLDLSHIGVDVAVNVPVAV